MQIRLSIEMPEPSHPMQNQPEALSIEEKVRDALDTIESGHESKREWNMINRLYKDLKAKSKPSERAQNLIDMIDPVLSKFGYHGVGAK